MAEVWKDVIDSDGKYKINTNGEIFNNQTNQYVKKFLKPKGYQEVKMKINNQWKSLKVHRILCQHFLENKLNKEHVNHIDGNKSNNNLENLEWVTNRENVCHHRRTIKKSSGYIGVSWHKLNKRWISQIRINDKMIFLGSFINEIDAYNARVKYEKENLINNKYL